MNLTKKQREDIEAVGKEYSLKFIILHGSRATETARENSDLDIAALSLDPCSFEKFLAIQSKLADILGDNQKQELDFKLLNGADPLFRYFVTRDGILLYGNPTAYNEYKAYAFRAYVDSKDLRELENNLLKKSILKLSHRYARP